jgi:prepilin-type N-terminal cleavage/methylation domain-containing protein
MARRGYTLSELLIAVVIMGVMASVAVPTFTKSRERATANASRDMLLAIYTGEQVYASQNGGAFLAIGEGDPSSEWLKIFVDNPNAAGFPVRFSVTAGVGPPPVFVAQARRVGGGCDNDALTINELKTTGGVTGGDGSDWSTGTC